MRLYQRSDNARAEARTTDLTLSGEEGIEDLVTITRRDPRSIVPENDVVVITCAGHTDLYLAGARSQRILDEIAGNNPKISSAESRVSIGCSFRRETDASL